MVPRPFGISTLHLLASRYLPLNAEGLSSSHPTTPQWLFCTYDWILNLDREVRSLWPLKSLLTHDQIELIWVCGYLVIWAFLSEDVAETKVYVYDGMSP